MRYTKSIFNTQRETPAEATLLSHILMLRAGLVRKVSSGIYSYMPAGLRVLRKIEQIVREEMDKAGAIEVEMPLLVPEEFLQRSGRWEESSELYTLTDRGKSNYALSPTNEENFSELASSLLKSYRQFPISLYQINHKFRDEVRPRYGVMRAKEFVMKDAYSFHLNEESLVETYDAMRQVYLKIFARLNLNVVHVKAASGAMGGKISEEFIMPSDVGEETIVKCSKCTYVANDETATEKVEIISTDFTSNSNVNAVDFEVGSDPRMENADLTLQNGSNLQLAHTNPARIATPNITTIEKLCSFLDCNKQQTIKTMVYAVSAEDSSTTNSVDDVNAKKWPHFIIAIIRGDYDINEHKLLNHATQEFSAVPLQIRAATDEEIFNLFKCKPGFLSPISLPVFQTYSSLENNGVTTHQTSKNNFSLKNDLKNNFTIYCDKSLKGCKGMIAGANEEGYHLLGIDVERDIAKQHFSSNHFIPESSSESYTPSTTQDDLSIPFHYFDLLLAKAGGTCVECGEQLQTFKGIELGHIFQLGKRYTHAFQHRVSGENSENITPTMGCYGIGISRVFACVLEIQNDKNGIIFPAQIAPFFVSLLLLNSNEKDMRRKCDKIYQQFNEAGIEILYDDRDERPGIKFQDADLLGCPHQIIYSKRTAQKNEVEIKNRATGERTTESVDKLCETFTKMYHDAMQSQIPKTTS